MADLQTNLQRLENNSDEILSLVDDISDAIIAKGGTVPANTGLRGFANAINSIPSGGGGSSNDAVRFIDYDGTVVQSYSAADFANLSTLPANPSHTGLTAQGWNWSLADAKEYVAENGKLNIGQMYITEDGKTRLYITLLDGRTSPVLQLYLNDNSELDIDWGDGGTHSTFTTTTAGYKSERHNYASPGDYIIAITVTNGSFVLQSSSTAVSSILWDEKGTNYSSDRAYTNSMKKVEIGSGVTSISDYAFYVCFSLSSITIPNSVTSIGDRAFYNCNSLSLITIPDSVTSISDYAFYVCFSLSSITIPNSVTSIGNNAFNSCNSLSSITIPDGVTSIGTYTFQYCSALQSITIPDSVTSIGQYAFSNCPSLQSITIPDGVTSIGPYTFNICYALSSITIPDSVTSIGDRAFYNCNSLSSVTIPDGVTSIGDRAFSGCYSLISITIPDSVKSIDQYAFNSCYALTSVVIGSGVTSIGNNTFSSCSSIDYIKFKRNTPPTLGGSSALPSTTRAKILVPLTSWDSYKSKTNYPNPLTFKYIAYNTYELGETLPTTATDITTSTTYNLTWYATMNDAYNETNPITDGNGNEVYARCIVST